MVTYTNRDAVWTAALELVREEGSFESTDMSSACRDQHPSERTMRDVLRTMTADG